MTLGDGICRNPAKITNEERRRLRDAFLALDADGQFAYPDGVSYWDKHEDIRKTRTPPGRTYTTGRRSCRGTASYAIDSKNITVAPEDSELGFDPQLNEEFPNPTYDLMYAAGPDPGYPDGSISLNSWDWEYLRTQLAKLPSTGPTGDPIHQDVLTQFGSGIVAIAGYYAKDDQAQHVIVGTKGGTLHEVYWKPAQGVHQDVLTQFTNEIVGVGDYYANDDDTQHAIVATTDGTLTEVYWKPAQGVHQDVLTQFGSGIVAIAGYYAKDDQAQHVIVGTKGGTLHEVYWKPAQGVHQDVLTQFTNEIVGVGDYYADDDDTQHAIVATTDGTLTEVYWKQTR